MSGDPNKRVFIIAGPNGAGKTTFAHEFLPSEPGEPAFLNADDIALQLCPAAPDSVAVRAARTMLEAIVRHVEEGKSFAVETTLSGRNYARAIPRWQAKGYEVILHFLRLPDPDTAVARVAGRIREGGHRIPPGIIRRRFHAGWRNFQEIYRGMVNSWFLYDSFAQPPRLMDQGISQ